MWAGKSGQCTHIDLLKLLRPLVTLTERVLRKSGGGREPQSLVDISSYNFEVLQMKNLLPCG